MATNKTYSPGGFPVISDPTANRRYLTGQLAQISQTLAALNAAINTTPTTFATLPTPSPLLTGSIRCVADSTVSAWNATVAGGGTHTVLCWCNGTNWTVIGF